MSNRWGLLDFCDPDATAFGPDWDRDSERLTEQAERYAVANFPAVAVEALTESDGVLEQLESAWHFDDHVKAGRIVLTVIDQYALQVICKMHGVEPPDLGTAYD